MISFPPKWPMALSNPLSDFAFAHSPLPIGFDLFLTHPFVLLVLRMDFPSQLFLFISPGDVNVTVQGVKVSPPVDAHLKAPAKGATTVEPSCKVFSIKFTDCTQLKI